MKREDLVKVAEETLDWLPEDRNHICPLNL
jgi:hypothetical protein